MDFFEPPLPETRQGAAKNNVKKQFERRREQENARLRSKATSDADVYQGDIIEQKFGVCILEPYTHPTQSKTSSVHRTGYAYNLRPTLQTVTRVESERPGKRSGVHIYFVDSAGDTFRATYLIHPYFYVRLASHVVGVDMSEWDHYRHQLIHSLEQLAAERCSEKVFVSLENKIDLAQPGHIQPVFEAPYRMRQLIRISFLNVEDARTFRRELESRIKRNQEFVQRLAASALQETGERAGGADRGVGKNTHHRVFLGLQREIQTQLDADPLSLADGLLETDIPLVSRLCIDTGIRCGKWYDVRAEPGEQIQIHRCPEHQQSIKPPLRYLAWDIEVTKDPLKFPSPYKDSISLISYMCDQHGFLIVNRRILSEDILDFEYTPKPEFPGHFHIFNVEDERALIVTFYDHMRKLEPHILVTFNGDNFDFEFLRLRGLRYGISMLSEIGFPYTTNDGCLPAVLGEPTISRTVMGTKQEYQGKHQVHIDCLRWVERDSYLPCGSRGLKSVTKSKLRYHPRELDPELMAVYAVERPRQLAEYSVSDAVATYYLYEKYIHNFTFALASIIPLAPDDVLRKGSGTLCEHLLMAEAYRAQVVFPNKHTEDLEKWRNDRLLLTETYVGGNVAQLNSGIFRCDLPEAFQLNPQTFNTLISSVDDVIDFWFRYDEGKDIFKSSVTNLGEVRETIINALALYSETPQIEEEPLIYHFDVAAMYPNIILSHRLQPTSIVSDSVHCKQCTFFNQKTKCQKKMLWQWKGEEFPLTRGQIEFVRDQLSNERFTIEDGIRPIQGNSKNLVSAERVSDNTESDSDNNENQQPFYETSSVEQHKSKQNGAPDAGEKEKKHPITKSWNDLTEKQQYNKLIERLKLLSRKQSGKFKVAVEEIRQATVCMRENPFYVQTVRDFRDRRYIFKVKKREAERRLEGATDAALRHQYMSEVVLYDSLQLAHKCILNSFYGYVMRKGSRWYSMEMAAVVTYTGAQIIGAAYRLARDVGKPLELDTDGIWTLLPKRFPQNVTIQYVHPDSKRLLSKVLNYPCCILNHQVYHSWANKQYMTLDSGTGQYVMSTEHCVFFEVDGPYKAMALPASEKEGMSVKKRYAVFDMDNKIVELKGFELKRRGELELIKIFQEEVFPEFLKGKTRQEAYAAVANVANRWIDFLDTRGQAADDMAEVFELIAESKFLSKPVKEQGTYKSMGVTTARRLTELLGDPTYVNDKGIKCEYVVGANNDMEKTLRAIPVQLFSAPLDVQQLHLQRWLGVGKSAATDPRSFIDWTYYRQRLLTAILKIIVIPALNQGQANPVPRVVLPDWVRRSTMLARTSQTRLPAYFLASFSSLPSEKTVEVEDLVTTLQPPTVPQHRQEVEHPSHLSLFDWLVQRQSEWKQLRRRLMQMRHQDPGTETAAVLIMKSLGSANLLEISKRGNFSDVFQRSLGGVHSTSAAWYIVDIEKDPRELGLLQFYVVLDSLPSCVFRVPVQHLRRIVVNNKQPSFWLGKDIHVKKISSPSDYTLPRRLRPRHLFELYLTEATFQEHRNAFRATGNVISVYGCSRPFDFDLLCCYGNTVRLSNNPENIKLTTLRSCGVEAFQGPRSFEMTEQPFSEHATAAAKFQWIFVVVVHDGPADNPDRVIAYLFRPPMLCLTNGTCQSPGSSAIFVGGGSSTFQNQARSSDVRHIFLRVIETIKSTKLPTFLTLNEDLKLSLIENWAFSPPQQYSTTASLLRHLSECLQKTAESAAVHKHLPISVSLLTSLPPKSIGPWADPALRATVPFIIPLATTRIPLHQIKLSKFNFFADAVTYSTEQCLKNLYLAEWSAFVASIVQIPVLSLMRWTASPHSVQRNILDLVLARGLEANNMIPWDSDDPQPDLGTPILEPRSVADYETPRDDSLNFLVHPSVSWTITFRLGFGGQFALEALTHLSNLVERYGDPIRCAFSTETSKSKDDRRLGTIKPDSTLSGNIKQETSLDECFQHTSMVPPKLLVVMQRCLQHFNHRIKKAILLGNTVAGTPCQAAAQFLATTIRRVQAWQDTPASLFHDPTLQYALKYWTGRYIQALQQEIKRVSDHCIEALLITPSTLTVTTPSLSLRIGQNCLALLFEALRNEPLFENLHPESWVAFRGFLLLDHTMWLGLRLAGTQGKHSVTDWENHLSSLFHAFPDPLRCFIQRAAEDIVTGPLRAAGLSPDQDVSNEHELLDVITAAAHHQVSPPSNGAGSGNPSCSNNTSLVASWLPKLENFTILKQEWLESGSMKRWETAFRHVLERELQTLQATLPLSYVAPSVRLTLDRRLRKLQNLIRLPANLFAERLAWTFPQRSGLLSLKSQSGELPQDLSSASTQGINRAGQHVELTPSLTENQLQLAVARVLYLLLTSHPHYWTLEQDARECWLDVFASALRVSPYANVLEYQCLYSPLVPASPIECTFCGLTFSLNLAATLMEDPTSGAPYWACPDCSKEISLQIIEQHVIETLELLLEAAQAQDITCSKCQRLQERDTTPFCHCGGTYRPRIPRIELQLVYATIQSLAEKYPLHFPWLFATINQHLLLACY